MDAAPADQLRLLDLQALDASLDRLAARRRGLPELAEVEDLTGRLRALSDDIVGVETEIADIARGQSKLETDVDLVRARYDRDSARLQSGANAREAVGLQAELDSLRRRQGVLEDEVLEVMERREAAEARLAELTGQRDDVAARLAAAENGRDAALAEIDAEAERERAGRAELAPTLPADLVALYEKVRTSAGGVGAAGLVRRRCEGCHLELSGADLREARDAPPERVLRCEECRRILVRTTESGL